MKNILITLFFLLSSVSVFADASNAQQNIQLNLQPIIEISSRFQSINFQSLNSESFSVRSNKEFKVSVSTESENKNVKVSLVNNKTTGKATANSNNMPVSMTAQDIIANCSRGDQQSFAVNYKTKSNATVVYTATQP